MGPKTVIPRLDSILFNIKIKDRGFSEYFAYLVELTVTVRLLTCR